MAACPKYKLYIALKGTQVVGTFAVLIVDNLAHLGAPSAVVKDVAKDPLVRTWGIDMAMMRHTMPLALALALAANAFSRGLPCLPT